MCGTLNSAGQPEPHTGRENTPRPVTSPSSRKSNNACIPRPHPEEGPVGARSIPAPTPQAALPERGHAVPQRADARQHEAVRPGPLSAQPACVPPRRRADRFRGPSSRSAGCRMPVSMTAIRGGGGWAREMTMQERSLLAILSPASPTTAAGLTSGGVPPPSCRETAFCERWPTGRDILHASCFGATHPGAPHHPSC